MRNPFPSVSRIARQLHAAVITRFTASRLAKLLIHDPAASHPHDLDDPYFDPNVQRRIGGVIAGATAPVKKDGDIQPAVSTPSQ